MTHATPAPAQETGTVRVSNLNQPSIRHTAILRDQYYAQSCCTNSIATTVDKVRLHILSYSAVGSKA